MEKSTGGGGTDCAETHPPGAGFRMQAQARGRLQPGTALPTSAQERRGDRDVVRRKSKFSAHPPCCSVHGAQQRGKPGIAHNALLSGAEGKNGKTGGSRVRAAESLMPGTNSGLRSSSSAHPRRGNHTQRDAPENAPPPHFSPHNTRLGLRNVGRTRIRLSSILPRERECPSPKSPRNTQAQGKQRRPPGRCRKQATRTDPG